MNKYVLVIKDKLCPGEALTFGSNLEHLKAIGIENVQVDRVNVIAEVWSLVNGAKDRYMCNCNLLLESYEG